jgi:hypothetical protein
VIPSDLNDRQKAALFDLWVSKAFLTVGEDSDVYVALYLGEYEPHHGPAVVGLSPEHVKFLKDDGSPSDIATDDMYGIVVRALGTLSERDHETVEAQP